MIGLPNGLGLKRLAEQHDGHAGRPGALRLRAG